VIAQNCSTWRRSAASNSTTPPGDVQCNTPLDRSPRRNAVARMGGGGFQRVTIIANITAGSGMPLTPVYIAAVRNTGVTAASGRLHRAPVYAAPAGRFLNPAAYAAAAAGLWGDAGGTRSPVRPVRGECFDGRSFGDVDLRFDSTNALNRVTFPSWNTTVNGAQFGLPNPANAMRSVQATLRWRF